MLPEGRNESEFNRDIVSIVKLIRVPPGGVVVVTAVVGNCVD